MTERLPVVAPDRSAPVRARDWRNGFGISLLVAMTAALFYRIDPQFFFKDDFQLQFLPVSREIARAWMRGELPLLTQSSWFSSALAAEYQFGVFSLFRAICDVAVWTLPLSMAARAATLYVLHAMVCAWGAFLLARSYGVRGSSACMVALVAAMNGWLLWWGTTWFVAMAAFAWLPWYWLGLRAVWRERSPQAIAGTAVALYLLVAAGSPYVVGMAILVFVLQLVRTLMEKDGRAAIAILGSSTLGACLAAPAILVFVEYLPFTARASMVGRLEATWVVPPLALFGLAVPAFATRWPTFAGSLSHHSVELLGGFVPLAAVLGILGKNTRTAFLRRCGGELVLFAAGLTAVLLPAPAPFRWSFHWLPLALLALALAGAVALEQTRGAWKAGLVLLAASAAAAWVLGTSPMPALAHAVIFAALCGVWAVLERQGREGVMPPLITFLLVVVTFVGFHSQREVPVWRFDGSMLTPTPFEKPRRYLSMIGLESFVGEDRSGRYSRGTNAVLRPGNTAMLAGLRFVNGYSPMAPEGLEMLFGLEPHGAMLPERVEPLLRFESGRGQLLDHLGVDGLIVPRALAARHRDELTANGWRVAALSGGAAVLQRTTPPSDPLFMSARGVKVATEEQGSAAIFERRSAQLPVVLFTPGESRVERYGPRLLKDIAEARLATTVTVAGKGPKTLIVFRRPWLPGWRATIDGKPLPVLRADMVMPAVEIPQGETGRVRLFYRPISIVVGGVLAALAVLVLIVLRFRGRVSR